ncbi:MAG: DHH family phosphoesterase [Phycisphaerales bacterium]
MSYATNTTHAAVAAALRTAKRPFVTTHYKPDGDALGSVLAMARALRHLGSQVQAVVAGPVDRTILGLAAEGEVQFVERGAVTPDAATDLALVVDTGARSQLEHLSNWLPANHAMVVGLDHHRSGDPIASRRIVDASCASTTQVLVPVLDELGVPLAQVGKPAQHSIAEALFAGLATDTGWFRFSSADERVFQLCARLLSHGVDKDRLYRMIEQGDAPGRPLLVARALRSLEYAGNHRIAIMRLTRQDFADTDTRVDDLAGLVNEPMSVGAVEVSVLLVQHDANLVKISFRSKPPAKRGGWFVDVNHVAAHFDGGGHVHAAGARMQGTMDAVATRVRSVLESYLEDAASHGATL